MYIGDVDNANGGNHVVFELVANVLDQFLAGSATRCEITLEGFNLTISDDGPGLSFRAQSDHGAVSQAEYSLENAHFGATAHGHAPHVHLVFNGVGLAVVNALCSEFKVVSRDGMYAWSHAYEMGIPRGKATEVEDKGSSGTRIVLRLDEEIFQCPPDPAALHSILHEKSHLFPGFEILFNGSRFLERHGLMSLAKCLCQGEAQPFLWHREEHSDFLIDLALAGSGSTPLVSQSWVNGSLTQLGGSHQIALDRAVKRAGWVPLVSLVHVIMLQPEFAGPTKDRLSAPSLEGPLEATFFNALVKKSV